ncbi:MAG: MFS transporter [Acidobacteria bacterium]|nr:MFS transporter [Acidobacteriota bacterium]
MTDTTSPVTVEPLPQAKRDIIPLLLPVVLALAGAAGGATSPSRDMIVRNVTPPGATGKVFGFVYSGLDIGSFLAPPLFGYLMSLGMPAAIFWIAICLYVTNVGIVMSLRRSGAAKAVPAVAE